jgi:T5SS/PEP-CTERM-associated repeat protein
MGWSMNYFERILFRVLYPSLLIAISAANAWAVHPPGKVTFYWTGTGNDHMGGVPTGNGKTGDWENWQRSSFFPDDLNFPPLDGDLLDISNVALHQPEIRHTITISNLSLHVGVLFDLNADFSGGHLDVDAVEIANLTAGGIYYTSDFSGTTIEADNFNIDTVGMPITFSGSTLSAPELRFTGTDQNPSAPLVGGQARVNVMAGSSLEFFTLQIGRDHYSTASILNPFVLNVDASTLTGLGMDVSGGEFSQRTARVQLANGSHATLEQFVVVGSAANGELDVSGSSNLTVTSGYLNIGDLAQGSLHVNQNAEVHTSDFNVGVLAQGDVAADSDGKIYSTAAYVGVYPDHDGTVNLEGGALWQTGDLQLGASGTGYVYVRNDGTLTIDHEAVLGLQPGSRGVLNLIGSQAHLELATLATLAIGKQGTGELNLSEGATLTAMGDVSLGEFAGGTGVVTVDGNESHLTVDGALTIGEASVGRVEIRNKGKLTVTHDQITLGTDAGGDGTLLVTGDDSNLDFQDELIVGDLSKGTLNISDGAQVQATKITLGSLNESEGTLNLSGHGMAPSMLETTDEGSPESPSFIVGEFGTGTMNVTDSAQVVSAGAVVLASEINSNATVNVVGPVSQWELNDLTVGKSGAAIVTLDKGRLIANGDVVIGETGTAESSVTVKGIGGELRFGQELTVGHQGIGKLIVESGARVEFSEGITAVQVADEAAVGGGTSSGIVEIKGQDSKLASTYFDAGSNGVATVALSDKATIGSSVVRLGALSNAAGSSKADVTVSDATWTIEQMLQMRIGGSLSIGDGGKVKVQGANDDSVILDGSSLRPSKITIDGAASELTTSGNLIVGAMNGDSEVLVKGGGYLETKLAQVRGNNLSTVTISGAQSEWDASGLDITENGSLLIQAGGLVQAANVYVGYSANVGHPTLFVDGSNSRLYDDEDLFVTYGSMSVTGGANVFTSEFKVGGNDFAEVEVTGSGSSLIAVDATVSSGELRIVNGGFINTHELKLDGATGRVFVDGANASVHADSITIGSGIMHVQNGAQVMAESANISGQGVLVVTLDGSVTLGNGTETAPLRTVQVNAGGVLSGDGTIFGNLIVKKGGGNTFKGGIWKPGNSPGTFTVEGDVTIEEGGVLEMEIGGLAAGSQHDQVVATGSITAGGILDLHIVNSGSGFQLPSIGDEFTLLSAGGGISGTFENAAQLRSIAGGSLVEWSLTPGTIDAVLKAVAITPLLDGDYNGNGVVDAADYTVWRDTLGGINLAADGNRDGTIDELDYAVWKNNFGAGSGGGSALFPADSSAPGVPEPASLLLTILAAGCCCDWRRQGA